MLHPLGGRLRPIAPYADLAGRTDRRTCHGRDRWNRLLYGEERGPEAESQSETDYSNRKGQCPMGKESVQVRKHIDDERKRFDLNITKLVVSMKNGALIERPYDGLNFSAAC